MLCLNLSGQNFDSLLPFRLNHIIILADIQQGFLGIEISSQYAVFLRFRGTIFKTLM